MIQATCCATYSESADSKKLQARETPNDRRKLSESVFEGPFKSK